MGFTLDECHVKRPNLINEELSEQHVWIFFKNVKKWVTEGL